MSETAPGKIVFFADAYFQPDNVHTRDDGSTVVYGPHGAEFPVRSLNAALITGIERGLLLDHQGRLDHWQHSNSGPEVWKPEDVCA